MSEYSDNIRKLIIKQLEVDSADQNFTLNNTLRLLGKWRSTLLQNTLIQNHGTTVLQGPMKGLEFLRHSSEGCHVPKLLGTYEQPLHHHITEAINHSYDNLLNIGCAEGYYAVGLARLMTKTVSYAYDIDANARESCRALAIKNGVEDRLIIGELFTPDDFAKFEVTRTLVFCDIEGSERELLNPVTAPALKTMDIIVESHECLVKGVTEELISRFSSTHSITKVSDDGSRSLDYMPDWYKNLAHLDQLIGLWEWRSGPTPWLVMKAKGGAEA